MGKENKKQEIKTLKELQEYLQIDKHTIIAKKPCEIFIDKSEYKDNEINETAEYYILPGILEIHFIDDDKFVIFPFNYDLHVYKPDEIIEDKDYIILRYQPGDVIVNQKYKDTSFNFNTTLRLFQGQAKFIKKPEDLVLLCEELVDYKIDLVFIEILVQQLYRCKDDETKPCRLCNYKDCELVPIPQLPYKISWLLGIGFERIDKAIKNALINKVGTKGTSYEKILVDY